MAKAKHNTPTYAADWIKPTEGIKNLNNKEIGINAPLTKLGTVVVTVIRTFVPNCSEEYVKNTAQ
jgi:hypothetical protein